jgi:hypothetical protein
MCKEYVNLHSYRGCLLAQSRHLPTPPEESATNGHESAENTDGVSKDNAKDLTTWLTSWLRHISQREPGQKEPEVASASAEATVTTSASLKPPSAFAGLSEATSHVIKFSSIHQCEDVLQNESLHKDSKKRKCARDTPDDSPRAHENNVAYSRPALTRLVGDCPVCLAMIRAQKEYLKGEHIVSSPAPPSLPNWS